MTKNNAFVFIELLFVLFLIAILSSIAALDYSDYLVRFQTAEGFLLAIPVKKAVSDYYAYHGSFPTDNLAAGLSKPEQLNGNYVNRIEINNGQISVTFSNQSLTKIRDKMIYFVPEITRETIIWYCAKTGNMTIEAKYLGSCAKK